MRSILPRRRRLRDTSAASLTDLFLVAAAFALILGGAELFTGGVEWLGRTLGMTQGATGSILAAFGTAMPETLIPIVAILFTNSPEADEIGVGAILGAPFMLATLVMLLMGLVAFVLRKKRGGAFLRVDSAHASRDLSFFLVLYSFAIALAVLPAGLHFLKAYLGWVFIPAYGIYLFLVLRTPATTAADIEEEKEAFDELTLGRLLRRFGETWASNPPLWLVLAQTVLAFTAIVIGARFFATFVEDLSHAMGLNALLVALVLAPLATELPEAANSLLWTRDGKDVIALGNVAGAMVLQSSIPVTLGVLFTPWVLGPFGTLAAVLALISAFIIWVQLRLRAGQGTLPATSLMFGGSLYFVFLGYVVWATVQA